MKLNEYIQFDGVGLSEIIKSKQVTAEEVLDAAIEQTEKTNPILNAVVYKMYDQAKLSLKQLDPKSPLYGVPFFLKDLGIYLEGTPTTYGSRLLKDYKAGFNSEIVKRYQKAGLVFLGKTNIPEFGTMGISEPRLYGPSRNPWNSNLTPGGSSGGSGSAVAARMAPIASADDGGGSIRIPASACGLVGLKPSRGLMPMGPDKTESWLGLVSGHVVSRSIRDTTLLLDLCKGALPGSPYFTTPPSEQYMSFLLKPLSGKKIGFSTKSIFGKQISPDCQTALLETIKLCKDLGMETEEADLPIDSDNLGFAFLIILACSTSADVLRAEKLTHKKADLSQIEWSTYFLKNVGAKMKAPLLEWAIYQCRIASLILAEYHKRYDFFCCSTMAFPPAPIGLMEMNFAEKIGALLSPYVPSTILISALKQMSLKAFEKTPNTELFNMTGQPAISLPAYWNKDNLPIGVQFVAPLGQDQLLLQLGSHLENIIQWQNKIPSGI